MTKTCPKCSSGGEMHQGFILDNAMGARLVASFIPGAPKASFWRGPESAKVDMDTAIPIGAYRCEVCGFLELYARPEFAVATD